MPIYEYQCQSCHAKLETLQKMSDAPLTDCPSCHQPELKKLISASAFQLTGTGWYASDFKSPPAEAKPAAEKTSGNTAAVPEAKKPEPKAEVKPSESKSTETKAPLKTDPTTK